MAGSDANHQLLRKAKKFRDIVTTVTVGDWPPGYLPKPHSSALRNGDVAMLRGNDR